MGVGGTGGVAAGVERAGDGGGAVDFHVVLAFLQRSLTYNNNRESGKAPATCGLIIRPQTEGCNRAEFPPRSILKGGIAQRTNQDSVSGWRPPPHLLVTSVLARLAGYEKKGSAIRPFAVEGAHSSRLGQLLTLTDCCRSRPLTET